MAMGLSEFHYDVACIRVIIEIQASNICPTVIKISFKTPQGHILKDSATSQSDMNVTVRATSQDLSEWGLQRLHSITSRGDPQERHTNV